MVDPVGDGEGGVADALEVRFARKLDPTYMAAILKNSRALAAHGGGLVEPAEAIQRMNRHPLRLLRLLLVVHQTLRRLMRPLPMNLKRTMTQASKAWARSSVNLTEKLIQQQPG